ncbi:hypothetical protein EDB19DRAFT_1978068 [Suillus lakei]|nr:hypothetical protein EDB19DRAFT_1978068 [Suillus lakei]
MFHKPHTHSASELALQQGYEPMVPKSPAGSDRGSPDDHGADELVSQGALPNPHGTEDTVSHIPSHYSASDIPLPPPIPPSLYHPEPGFPDAAVHDSLPANWQAPLHPVPVHRSQSFNSECEVIDAVTLNQPSLVIPLVTSLIPKERLLAYQFVFDLVGGGALEFLQGVKAGLPEGKEETQDIYDGSRNNKVDRLIVRNVKDVLEARASIYHTAVTLQNASMHAGTTSDVFLHKNLKWLGLASHWAKFSTTTALGVIHKGYFEEGMNSLGPYLPQAGGESQIQEAAYSEGGALYALGLINAGCGSGQPVENYLHATMKTTG